MHVLIVSDIRSERDAMVRSLSESGVQVTALSDGRSASAHLDEESIDVVVIEWGLRSPTAAELLQRMREREEERHVYAIVVMGNPNSASIHGAFAAGGDDLLRKPFLREEFLARIAALERIRAWAPRALASTLDFTTALSRLEAWRSAPRLIALDLRTLFGRVLEEIDREEMRFPTVMHAALPIFLASRGVECRLTMGIDALSLQELSRYFFGPGEREVDLDALQDILRELSNIAAGAVANAASAEDVGLTLALPFIVEGLEEPLVDPTRRQEFALSVAGTSIQLGLRLQLETRELRRMAPNQLREGMIVARPVTSDQGVLFVAAGTRLTATTAARLAEILSPRAHVTVVVPWTS